MRDLESYLENKKIDYNKLLKYGFEKENDNYTFKTNICDNQFQIIVNISENNKNSKLIDLLNREEYILVDIVESTGEFVGKVRDEYNRKLKDIINNCTMANIFKSEQTREIIEYVKQKYNDELEFLWEKYDNNAIWRNKQNNKWYGAVLTVAENKIGIDSEKIIEIIDLRYQKEEVEKIIDIEQVFPGYHMNKKSWITIKLDYTMSTKDICDFIDNSYNLSLEGKKRNQEKELAKKVYEYLTTIPKGKVVTYKQVAEYLGNKGLARVVGNILHKNPDEDKYPCYKVLNSQGKLAEEFVFGGKNKQKEKLEQDGIYVENDRVDLKKYQWRI